MGPHRYRRHRGTKRDTPVKAALSRRDKCRRLLHKQQYETLPEEPEEVDVPAVVPVFTRIKPFHCTSAPRWSNSAFSETPRDEAFTPAMRAPKTPVHRGSAAGHPTRQTTPEPEAFKFSGMTNNLTVTLGSVTESDTSLSSDEEEEEEDCCSSGTSSSSLPSPEIFRRDCCAVPLTSFQEELLGLHFHVKNSTLLDVSHAESLRKHHSPNVSDIIDASVILAEKNCEVKGPEAETKIHADPFKSETTFEWKTPPKLSNRKPILYKKKVWFKIPIMAEPLGPQHTQTPTLSVHDAPDPVHVSGGEEVSSSEDALRLTVTLTRPVTSSPDDVTFFDFNDAADRDAFFIGMRTRCVKLTSAPLFPLTALECTESSPM
ncbi:uncharacterized protein LOC116398065 isoform X1 [Anarrhichthys ocellatus]|uniref:uncharacterized protein LOC116398065 isoform X1 n=1 Tax=Anarrhichthys ocellatus TaxID=433405 RepID=UPI0012ECEE70|nr:uncharacterized protein LOC116398065 isoform X1 [Anarrhichthys ocellatus]